MKQQSEFKRTFNSSMTRVGLALIVLGATTASYGQWAEQVVYSFAPYKPTGDSPEGPVVMGADGALYGETSYGGTYFAGTVFKMNPDGSAYTVLHVFGGFGGATAPNGGLVQGADGALYGTTRSGGKYGAGTVFRLTTDGANYTQIYSFGVSANDGKYPNAVMQGRDGFLYGTTSQGGAHNSGIVFKLGTDGSSYAVLRSFGDSTIADGGGLMDGLLQGADGALYGVTPNGGSYTYGTLYKINPDASGYTVLHSFGSGTDGRAPYCTLVQGRDGALYGTTAGGGARLGGTVFKINPDGTGYSVLYNNDGSGSQPHSSMAGLMQGTDGALYGTTHDGGANGLGAVFKINTNGAGFTTLYSFARNDSYTADAHSPRTRLTQGGDDTLYGTSWAGGTNGAGAVFRLGLAPSVIAHPSSSSSFLGASTRFLATASGPQPLSFQWLKNGVSLPDGGNVSGSTTSTLMLSNLAAADAATYSLRVTSWAGTVTSQPATLTVGPRPELGSVMPKPDGSFSFSLPLLPQLTGRVYVSTNLVDWVVLTNLPSTSGTLQITDTAATNSVQRFYRAVWLP